MICFLGFGIVPEVDVLEFWVCCILIGGCLINLLIGGLVFTLCIWFDFGVLCGCLGVLVGLSRGSLLFDGVVVSWYLVSVSVFFLVWVSCFGFVGLDFGHLLLLDVWWFG